MWEETPAAWAGGASSEHCEGHSYGGTGISGLLQAHPPSMPTATPGLGLWVTLPQTLDLGS